MVAAAIWLMAITGLVLLSVGGRARAQEPAAAKSVWDGVYTDEQAGRGKERYQERCSACHGDTLEGQGIAPALAGDGFLKSWDGRTVDDLVARTQATMPLDDPGSLTGAATRDIVAFLLQGNGFPQGGAELPGGSELKAIGILRHKP